MLKLTVTDEIFDRENLRREGTANLLRKRKKNGRYKYKQVGGGGEETSHCEDTRRNPEVERRKLKAKRQKQPNKKEETQKMTEAKETKNMEGGSPPIQVTNLTKEKKKEMPKEKKIKQGKIDKKRKIKENLDKCIKNQRNIMLKWLKKETRENSEEEKEKVKKETVTLKENKKKKTRK